MHVPGRRERMGRLTRADWVAGWRGGRRWARCRHCQGRLAEIGPERILWCPTCDTPERRPATG